MFKWNNFMCFLVGRLDLKVSKALLPNNIRIKTLVWMFHKDHASEFLHLPLGYTQQGKFAQFDDFIPTIS
jgi:hypothetical protein